MRYVHIRSPKKNKKYAVLGAHGEGRVDFDFHNNQNRKIDDTIFKFYKNLMQKQKCFACSAVSGMSIRTNVRWIRVKVLK